METRAARLAPRKVAMATIAALVVAVGVYAARGTRSTEASPPPNPPIPATVHTLAERKVLVWSDFSGRLQAVDSAEIRPEVGGRITAVLFKDGQAVEAGDVLFIIDPRPYEAAVAKAEANLASAKATAAYDKVELGRATIMLRSQTIAQRTYDERVNASRVADAAVKAAEAALQQASLDLDHAHVKAPISGRVGRAEITVGNLVEAGPNAPLLTRIVASRSIYADFDVDEQTYLDSVRRHAAGHQADRRIPVELSVGGDKEHIYRGEIYAFDNRIDVASGTIRARARFDNPDGALVPGMFVSVRLADGVARDALLVPERAVSFDQSKKFVYVVGPDNKVAYRAVELGKTVEAQRIVLKGLRAGDRVIVDGLQHVRPGAVVDATEAAPTRFALTDN